MYRIVRILVYGLSLLPFALLYLLSDLGYLFLYHLMGYRRKIVTDQLSMAFPEKSASEIQVLRRRFYRHFCDQWVETIKLISLPEKDLRERVQGNWEVLEDLRRSGDNACIFLGHQFNWEWANVATQIQSRQDFAGVYLPLASPVADRLMKEIRQRGGGYMISMKSSRSGFSWLKERQHILGLIADQNPSQLDQSYWVPFMGKPAPFFKGAETLGRRPRTQALFLEVKRLRRGYYRVNIERMHPPYSGWDAPGALTRHYVRRLEQSIREQPENWMWTHRRWKHTPPAKDPANVSQEQKP